MAGADGRSNGPAAMGGAPAARHSPRALVIGALGSLAILGLAVGLQAAHSWILKLPAQWLAVAILPVLIGLVRGGYIGRFSFAGVEVEAPPLKPVAYVAPGVRPADGKAAIAPPAWTAERQAEYERTHWIELVHIYQPSARSGQRYDISIYLVRHRSGSTENQTTDFTDVTQAEFYFGPSWGDRIFPARNDGGVIGVNTSAFGSFLATCRVTFNDGSEPVVLHRYIDFEMASIRGTPSDQTRLP